MTDRLALVTGASGWLGRRLVSALSREDAPWRAEAVRALVHGDAPPPTAPRVLAHRGDLRDPASLADWLRGAEGATLFHCAGLIHPRFIRDLYRVNVDGTRQLLEAARAAGVRRFIYISSSSPFGFSAPGAPFDEASPYHPSGHYGRSKQLAEELVLAARGLEPVVVRAPWFYGPDGPKRLALFFRLVRRGMAPVVSAEHRRSMVYVDNLCDGLLLCARAPAPGRVYWIADERSYAWGEIFDTIADVMERDFGARVRRSTLPVPRAVHAAAALTDGALQRAGLYSEKLHVVAELGGDIVCTIERARRELGYAPAVTLREGVRRTLAWMRRENLPF